MARITKRVRTVEATESSAREVAGGRRIGLVLHDGEDVPAILMLPNADRPAPAALLLHGYTSHKERMAESVGRALLRRGVASLAIDLPLHGGRANGVNATAMRSPFELLQQWRMAVTECGIGLRYLAEQPNLDPARLAIVGYSLGSFLGVQVAATEPLVSAVVLASGGDLPDRTPFGMLVRTVADPLRAVRRIAPRPLLMVNGRLDRTVTRLQGERLFEAAREPKEIRWYAGGHWPPQREIDGAAEWLAETLGAGETAEPARKRRAVE